MSAKHRIKFPYKEFATKPFPGSKRSLPVLRPIIPVTIFFQKKFVLFQALIDSGADFNIFHGDVAAYLGINLNKGSKRNIAGISGGKIKGFFDQFSVNFNLEKQEIVLVKS